MPLERSKDEMMAQVTRNDLESEWIRQLKEKYTVKIDNTGSGRSEEEDWYMNRLLFPYYCNIVTCLRHVQRFQKPEKRIPVAKVRRSYSLL
jgi:hypothetical protein